MQKMMDSPFIPQRFKNAFKAANDSPIEVPFRGEDGLVHLVIAEYETLCGLLVNTRDERADIQGSFVHIDTCVTCLGCLAEVD